MAHDALHLSRENLERPLDSALAVRSETVESSSPGHGGVRAQGESLDDVGTASEPAVDDDGFTRDIAC